MSHSMTGPDAPHGLCETLKNEVNKDLLGFLTA